METRKLTRLIALFGALACARGASAQGDLDILLRTVPPIVMIQFDTSGSMSNAVLPPQYITDRGTGSGSPPWNWFNTPTTGLGTPPRLAAQVVSLASPSDWNARGSASQIVQIDRGEPTEEVVEEEPSLA